MTPKNNKKAFSTILCIGAVLIGSGVTACNLVDDEPPTTTNNQETDGMAVSECQAQLEAVAPECLPGMQVFATYDEGSSNVLLVDDPAVSVGVGPNAWLIQVSGSADYIGSYQHEGESCSFGCSWCQAGESLCHSGLDENGVPQGCTLCIPWGVPDLGVQCGQFMAACQDEGLDETGSDGGLDETGPDGGLDETGPDGGINEPEGLLEYDCAQWEPNGAVTLDAKGNATVDAAIVEEIVVHHGDPLADCDGTTIRRRSDGYFAIGSMAPNGLLAQMGLQPGDTILAIDGQPMNDLDTIAATAVDLFLGSRITSGFFLAIRRGPEIIAKGVRVR
jgi:hypothetical protein